ncbi:hypothetical protein ACQP1V_41570 [Microtetraspora malaysiensis]|uniref:hypothetical protein n=1 Tax=Microtetraspora malaysiensis TaxID=161358 RepID=UPI003D8E6BC9
MDNPGSRLGDALAAAGVITDPEGRVLPAHILFNSGTPADGIVPPEEEFDACGAESPISTVYWWNVVEEGVTTTGGKP